MITSSLKKIRVKLFLLRKNITIYSLSLFYKIFILLKIKPGISKNPSGPVTGFDPDYNRYIKSIKPNLNLEPEEWYFKSDNNYTYMLEHSDQKMGDIYLNRIISDFPELYETNKQLLISLCHQNDLYGKTIKYLYNDFTECSPTNLRYILNSFQILKYINSNNLSNLNIIEIGGGYGGLAFYILKISPIFDIEVKTYSIFDLFEASQLQKRYLHALKVNNFQCLQIDNHQNLETNSFLISNFAYSEIPSELQKQYTEKIINPFTSHGFLTWNHSKVHEFVKDKHISIKKEKPPLANTVTNELNFYTQFYVVFKPLN